MNSTVFKEIIAFLFGRKSSRFGGQERRATEFVG